MHSRIRSRPWYNRSSIRLSIEIFIYLVITLSIQLASPADSTVAKWFFAVFAWLFNACIIIELSIIVGAIFSSNKTFRRLAPRNIFTVFLVMIAVWLCGTDIVSSLVQFNPVHHIAGGPASLGSDSPFTIRLRMANMIGILMGPGGYGRYFARSLGCEMLVMYTLSIKFISYVLAVGTIANSIGERTSSHSVSSFSSSSSSSGGGRGGGESGRAFFRTVILRDGYTWVGYLIEIAVFLVLNLALLGLTFIKNPGLLGPVLYSIVTALATLILLAEIVWIIVTAYMGWTGVSRRQLKWWSALLLFLYTFLVFSMVFTSFALYDIPTFWTNISEDINPYLLWLRMCYVASVFMIPGGYGREVTASLSIELVVIPMTFLWIIAILLGIDTIISANASSLHEKLEHKAGAKRGT